MFGMLSTCLGWTRPLASHSIDSRIKCYVEPINQFSCWELLKWIIYVSTLDIYSLFASFLLCYRIMWYMYHCFLFRNLVMLIRQNSYKLPLSLNYEHECTFIFNIFSQVLSPTLPFGNSFSCNGSVDGALSSKLP